MSYCLYTSIDSHVLKGRAAPVQSALRLLIINREIVRACRVNGIYTNVPMVATRYVGKVWEMVRPGHR